MSLWRRGGVAVSYGGSLSSHDSVGQPFEKRFAMTWKMDEFMRICLRGVCTRTYLALRVQLGLMFRGYQSEYLALTLHLPVISTTRICG